MAPEALNTSHGGRPAAIGKAPDMLARGARSGAPGFLADGMDTLPARKRDGRRERDAALSVKPGLVRLHLAESAKLALNPLHFVNSFTMLVAKLVTSLGLGIGNLMILDARSIETVEETLERILRV
jgi:hypothetical protein